MVPGDVVVMLRRIDLLVVYRAFGQLSSGVDTDYITFYYLYSAVGNSPFSRRSFRNHLISGLGVPFPLHLNTAVSPGLIAWLVGRSTASGFAEIFNLKYMFFINKISAHIAMLINKETTFKEV